MRLIFFPFIFSPLLSFTFFSPFLVSINKTSSWLHRQAKRIWSLVDIHPLNFLTVLFLASDEKKKKLENDKIAELALIHSFFPSKPDKVTWLINLNQLFSSQFLPQLWPTNVLLHINLAEYLNTKYLPKWWPRANKIMDLRG